MFRILNSRSYSYVFPLLSQIKERPNIYNSVFLLKRSINFCVYREEKVYCVFLDYPIRSKAFPSIIND